MNTVNLCGKIHTIKEFEKVTYVTIHCKDSRNNEFLDVTLFDKKFFNRYFQTGMWIGILGHIHKNKNRDYRQEIIADSMYFVGDTPTENEYKDIEIDEDTGEIFSTQLPNTASADTPIGEEQKE